MSEITLTIDEYNNLHGARQELRALRREREGEREAWDWLYQRRGHKSYFILRTLDGLMCYVPPLSPLVSSSSRNLHTGRLEVITCEREPADKMTDDPAVLPVRRLRKYAETDEQICGVPVMEEVRA